MNKETASTTQASGSSSSPSPQTSVDPLLLKVSQATSQSPDALRNWSRDHLLTAALIANSETSTGQPLEGCLIPRKYQSLEQLVLQLNQADEWRDEMLSQAVTYAARVAAARPAPPTSGSS
jgi:hypothetical protein